MREVLERYFEAHPRARGYVLDDQSMVRKHIMIFVNGRPVADRATLGDHVDGATVIDVIQALSGG